MMRDTYGLEKNTNVNPGSYTRATSYGAAKYVKKIDYDKDTGEIKQVIADSKKK